MVLAACLEYRRVADFYTDMQNIATSVLTEFKQNTAVLNRLTYAAPDPSTPWLIPAPTITNYTLKATASVVYADQGSAKYIDGKNILGSDIVVTCAVPAVEPVMSDTITLDGGVKAIKKITQIPALGVAVVYKLFVAG